MATRTDVRERTATAVVEVPVERDYSYTSFWLLRAGLFALPVIAGIDKFFDRLTDWSDYLWSGFPDLFNVSATRFMYGVGIVEIVAGIVVLLAPRIGSLLVAGWLAGIITNLVLLGMNQGEYWDIALRDFGLMIGALALFFLAMHHHGRRTVPVRRA
jgi:hypothetical protein